MTSIMQNLISLYLVTLGYCSLKYQSFITSKYACVLNNYAYNFRIYLKTYNKLHKTNNSKMNFTSNISSSNYNNCGINKLL